MALLLDRGKLSVALVDDHIQQCIAHLLRRNLAQVLPLVAAFVRAKLDFLSLDRSIERVELEAGDLVAIDADLLTPLIEETDPITKRPDFCNLAWHKNPYFPHRTPSLKSTPVSFVLLCVLCGSCFFTPRSSTPLEQP